MHMPAGSALPAVTLVQVPSVPFSAQERHAPVQALLQQIPWAQNPLVHSAPVEHEPPLPFVPQEALVVLHEKLGGRHWALVVQEEKHLAPVPLPLQT